jgi:hypothetical protein
MLPFRPYFDEKIRHLFRILLIVIAMIMPNLFLPVIWQLLSHILTLKPLIFNIIFHINPFERFLWNSFTLLEKGPLTVNFVYNYSLRSPNTLVFSGGNLLLAPLPIWCLQSRHHKQIIVS